MKKYKIIANPKSGNESAIEKISELIALMDEGAKIDLRLTGKSGDAREFAREDEGEDVVISIGGDGTLNEVVNGMIDANRKTPLAIWSGGTVNDFATAMEIPTDAEDFYEMLKANNTKAVDIGMAGDRAFINVAAGGMMTDIAYTVAEETKTILGRAAYYIEGIKEVAKLGDKKNRNYFKVKIQSEELNSEEEILAFICANSYSVGGFEMAPEARVDDGYLDVIMVKDLELSELPKFIGSFTKKEHTDPEKVIYLQTKNFKLSSDVDIIVDVDGEKAGSLPMEFKIVEKAINLIIK